MSDNDKYGGIKPRDIPLVSEGPNILPLSGRFGKCEMDIVAYLIVEILRHEDLWRPISFEDVHFAGKRIIPQTRYSHIQLGFEAFIESDWFTWVGDNKWEVTPEFVENCMHARTQ